MCLTVSSFVWSKLSSKLRHFAVTHSFALTLCYMIHLNLFMSLTVHPCEAYVLRTDTFLVIHILGITYHVLCIKPITGFDIRVGSLGKNETEFRLPRQSSNSPVKLPIKNTILYTETEFRDPRQTTEAEFLFMSNPAIKHPRKLMRSLQ